MNLNLIIAMLKRQRNEIDEIIVSLSKLKPEDDIEGIAEQEIEDKVEGFDSGADDFREHYFSDLPTPRFYLPCACAHLRD